MFALAWRQMNNCMKIDMKFKELGIFTHSTLKLVIKTLKITTGTSSVYPLSDIISKLSQVPTTEGYPYPFGPYSKSHPTPTQLLPHLPCIPSLDPSISLSAYITVYSLQHHFYTFFQLFFHSLFAPYAQSHSVYFIKPQSLPLDHYTRLIILYSV